MNFHDDINAGERASRAASQRYFSGMENPDFAMERGMESGAGQVVSGAETITVEHIGDIVSARQAARLLVQRLGFSDNQTTIVVTAVSELARNIILYASRGEISLSARMSSARVGIVVEACDAGPGIADVQAAMESGYSTSGGLGYGLSGVRGMADEFEISSQLGRGTRIVVTMWLR
jgi:serine/threonine-protein kinase RsbT